MTKLQAILIFISATQGLLAVVVFHHETVDVVEGQNISLPCIVKQPPIPNIVQMEWRKKGTKLIVYHVTFGTNLLNPNVSLQVEKNNQSLTGSSLQLHAVGTQDDGVYVCDITAFPIGTFKRETHLKVLNVTVKCDMSSTIQMNAGENVTIHCSTNALLHARFRWIKDNAMVSDNQSLKLWQMSKAQAGVYTLTVSAGNHNVYKRFNITVLALPEKDVTASPPYNSTEQTEQTEQTDYWNNIATLEDKSHTTPPIYGHPNTEAGVTWTTGLDANPTVNNTENNVTSKINHATSFKPEVSDNVTDGPATVTDHHDNNYEISEQSASTPSVQWNVSEWTTPIGLSHEVHSNSRDLTSPPPQTESSSLAFTEESITPYNIGNSSEHPKPRTIGDDRVVITESGGRGTVYIVLSLLILMFFTCFGICYRKYIIKKRMDQPPPFKPPPPPVKYAGQVRSPEIMYGII